MQTIKAFVYPNIVEVQVFDPTIFSTRNRVVYSRTIKVYQGIDNPIQVIFKNQDQVPVDLTGYAAQVDIQDPVNQLTVSSYAVNFTTITKGQGTIIIDADILNTLEQRFYKITVKLIKQSDNSEQPAYIDDNYGVPLDLQVLPAYYDTSSPAPQINETIIDGGIL